MCRCLRFFQFVLIGFLEDGVDASAPAATCCFTSLPLSLSSSSFPRRDASRYYLNRGGVIGLKNDGCSLMNTAPHDNQVDIEKSYSEHHAPPWCPSLVVVADSRRKFLRIFVTRHILFATCCLPIKKCYSLQQQDATAATTPTEAAIVDIGLLQESSSPSVVHVESLKIVRILGKGAYKTVYLVVVDDTSSQEQHQQQRYYFALAVEPVRTKTQVKESLRGIQIAAQLEQRLVTSLQESAGIDNDAYYFERIVDWWFQPFPPVIITSSSGDDGDDPNDTLELEIPQREQDRSKKPPSRFLGTQWLVAMKPVYDMDLKSFIQHSPLLYPVGGGESSSSSSQAANPAADVSSLPLLTTTETAALNLLRDVCHAGKLMHAEGLVHLDIKPKNIMLRSRDSSSSSHHHDQQEMTQPVLIDFGFSRFVKQREQDGSSNDVDHDLCFVEPGRVRGEVGYVLAQDVALYQACQRRLRHGQDDVRSALSGRIFIRAYTYWH
jgi:Protein kinase domain